MKRNFGKNVQPAHLLAPRVCTLLLLLGPLVLSIYMGSLQSARGAELTAAQKEYLKKLDGPIVLRGDYFKAISVAYQDFSKRLAANEAKSKIHDGDAATTLQWLSHIENYDIDIEQTDAAFIVYFSATVRGDAPMILGGIVKYEIDRKTFGITEKSTHK